MSTIKVNTITGATGGEVELQLPLKILETSAPSAVDTHGMLYVKSDGKLYYRHTSHTPSGGSAGDEVNLLTVSTGAVTALNNKLESRLVSIGSTTTQLDGEANLTFDGSDLACAANIDITGAHDLSLKADGQKIMFGANEEVSLTHVHDTGLLLNSTMRIQFNDSTQYIGASSGVNLDIGADPSSGEINLDCFKVDVNAALDVSGATTLNGDVTLGNATGDDITNTGRWVGDFVPKTDSSIDLGTSALQFAEAHIDTGYIDAITVTGTSTLAAIVGTSLSLTEGNITNAGDINCDSISVDAAGTGLSIDFSGGATGTSDITIADNLAEALVIQQSTNDYLKIVTTNSSESIALVGVSGTAISIGHSTSETTINDNLTVTGTTVLSGTSFGDNNITHVGDINCDSVSVDDAAVGLDIVFGGATTTNKITLTNSLADALSITDGSSDYMVFNTTADTITFGQNVDMNNQVLDNAVFQSYRETIVTPSISSGEVTFDLALGNVFEVTVDAAITNFNILNLNATANQATSFTVFLRTDGSAREIDLIDFHTTEGGTTDYPIKWVNGSVGPEPTHAAETLSVYTFTCLDGDAGASAIWIGFVSAVGIDISS